MKIEKDGKQQQFIHVSAYVATLVRRVINWRGLRYLREAKAPASPYPENGIKRPSRCEEDLGEYHPAMRWLVRISWPLEESHGGLRCNNDDIGYKMICDQQSHYENIHNKIHLSDTNPLIWHLASVSGPAWLQTRTAISPQLSHKGQRKLGLQAREQNTHFLHRM